MVEVVQERVEDAISDGLLIDGLVTWTGDDLALVMSHNRGKDSPEVHQFAWTCFLSATQKAQEGGLYGAGQDLLVDAPSGNVRGAGPAVAEIEFIRSSDNPNRRAEAFLVFAADKCGPGAYNFPLYTVFCDPMHNGGLLLNPKLHQGFVITVIDMDHKDREADRIIKLEVPERIWSGVCRYLRQSRLGCYPSQGSREG